MSQACFNEKHQCEFLQVAIGVTNTNQQVERECWSCRKGVFVLTRDLSDMPLTCKGRSLQEVTSPEIKSLNKHLQTT